MKARQDCGKVEGTTQIYAEVLGNENLKDTTGKNLPQVGYMTVGSCATMMSLPGDASVKINMVDGDGYAECK